MEKSIQLPIRSGRNTDDEKSKTLSSNDVSGNVHDSNDDKKCLPIGTVIEGTSYKIEDILGRGGFGITYKVFDIYLKDILALKEFFPEDYADRDTSVSLKLTASPNKTEEFDNLKARFFKEAQNLKNCTHPGIVKIHFVLTPSSTNTICYLMDYIKGVTFREKYEGHPLSFEEARSLILKIADPLQHMHEKNIIHFDLNPNNVMLRHDDGSVVIIDFGFSKQYDTSGNQKSSSLLIGGTKGYIAPELGIGRLKNFSPSPDIYALGGIFFFLLTGHNPVSYLELIQDNQLLLADIPSKLHPFFKKAMAIQVKERFQSVDEFCKALQEIDKLQIPKNPEGSRVEGSSKKKHNKKRLTILAMAISIIAFMIGGFFMIKRDSVDGDTVLNQSNQERQIAGFEDNGNSILESEPLIKDNIDVTSIGGNQTNGGSDVFSNTDNDNIDNGSDPIAKEEITTIDDLVDHTPPENSEEAKIKKLEELYSMGEERGARAAYELGNFYKNRNYPGDNLRAFEWFKRGAEAQNSYAMFELGNCYKTGVKHGNREIVPKNVSEAIKWWKMASNDVKEARIRLNNEDEYNAIQPD